MAIDAEVKVIFDNQLLGIGSVKDGFDFLTRTTVGKHSLKLKISMRKKSYDFDIQSVGSYQLKIDYSRMWGNFSDDFDLIRLSKFQLEANLKFF